MKNLVYILIIVTFFSSCSVINKVATEKTSTSSSFKVYDFDNKAIAKTYGPDYKNVLKKKIVSDTTKKSNSIWRLRNDKNKTEKLSENSTNTEKKLSKKEEKKIDEEFYVNYSKVFNINFDGSENKKLISTSAEWIGVPHRTGYASKNGTDCSGFVGVIYKEVYGISLGRSSRDMYAKDVDNINKSDLKEGDLLFFKMYGDRISHVGIYLKDNKFIHSSSSKGVTVSCLDEAYYKRTYFSAGRVKPPN